MPVPPFCRAGVCRVVVNLCGDVVRAVRAWVCDGRGVFCGPVKCAGRFETYAWVWVELLVHGFATGWAAGRWQVRSGCRSETDAARCEVLPVHGFAIGWVGEYSESGVSDGRKPMRGCGAGRPCRDLGPSLCTCRAVSEGLGVRNLCTKVHLVARA